MNSKPKLNKIFLLGLALVISNVGLATDDARELIWQVVEANGGKQALQSLNDVTFEYTFRSMEKQISDVSVERYIFNGEVSYAQYVKREYFVLPQMKGLHTQFFNGKETVSTINNEVISEDQAAYVGHFFRKTNFYWFNMMFKLLDPGVSLKRLPNRLVGNVDYQIVEMTFEENVGDTSDKYVLYINPKTLRVDQFLFTVLGFGFSEPFLMKLEYENIGGVYLSTYRKYAPADWDGNVVKEEWNEQITKNVQFNNGYTHENIKDSFLEQMVFTKKKIEIPALQAWDIVSDWTNLNKLAPNAVERTEVTGTGIDTNWTIYLKNGGEVKEEMLSFDENTYAMSYGMIETPMPLKKYRGFINVKSIGEEQCLIEFTTTFSAEEPNRSNLTATFKDFQYNYLSNIEKLFR